MLISGSDFQKNKVHGFWECFVFLCFLCEQWCFSCSDVFLFYIDWSHLSKWHLRIRKENHTSPHEFQQNTLKFILIISANVNIHTLDHFWIYSMIFLWGTKNHIRPVLEYIAQISQIPLVLCYEGRTSRTLLRRYILHLRLPQGREFVHYLKKIKIPQAMILYHFVKSHLKLPLVEWLSWYYK